ncbi:MAG TPA: hypothetical protein PLD68_12170, partial [Clostridiales bacterium]|nr:hypothetical protein [Clostridiales bacterium]
ELMDENHRRFAVENIADGHPFRCFCLFQPLCQHIFPLFLFSRNKKEIRIAMNIAFRPLFLAGRAPVSIYLYRGVIWLASQRRANE